MYLTAEKDLVRFAEYSSPFGVVLIAGGESGITDLSLTGDRPAFTDGLRRKCGCRPREDNDFFKEAFALLDTYFSGAPVEFTLPVDLVGTAFEMKVWQAIRDIPWGQTRTYGEVAAAIGSPGAARAVGGACGKNPVPLIVPCHRVVGSNGSPGGYTGGLEIKKTLLRIEGSLSRPRKGR